MEQKQQRTAGSNEPVVAVTPGFGPVPPVFLARSRPASPSPQRLAGRLARIVAGA